MKTFNKSNQNLLLVIFALTFLAGFLAPAYAESSGTRVFFTQNPGGTLHGPTGPVPFTDGIGFWFVPSGSTYTFTFVPNPGNRVAYVLDGFPNSGQINKGPITSVNVFGVPSGGERFHVQFAPNQFIVNSSISGQGTHNFPGAKVVPPGGTGVIFPFQAFPGHHISSALVDGVPQPGAVNQVIWTKHFVNPHNSHETHSIHVVFSKNTYTISGTTGMAGVTVTMTGSKSGSQVTGAGGAYSFTVEHGDSVVITPSKTGYSFSPGNRTHTNVLGNLANQDYTGTRDEAILGVNISQGGSSGSYSISGPTGIGSQSEFTNISGRTTNGSFSVPTGTYTVTFTNQASHNLSVSANILSVNANKASGPLSKNQIESVSGNYTIKTYTVSGTVKVGSSPLDGVTMTMSGSKNGTTTTNALGQYSFTVDYDDSVTITPQKTGYTFDPVNRSASNVMTDKVKNFDASRDLGRLKVDISRSSSGGSFSISGPTGIGQQSEFSNISGRNTNFNQLVPTGDYTVTFTNEVGYKLDVAANPFAVTNNSATGTLNKDQTETITGTYTLLTGSLKVNVATNPNHNPTNTDATWTASATSTVSGIAFSPVSGKGTDTITDIPLGTYEIVFDGVAGWQTPGNKTATVQAAPAQGNNAEVTGTYQVTRGKLTVNVATDPNHNPTKNNATWTLSQTSTLSGISFADVNGTGSQTINDVPLGDYKVVFNDVAGWITPGNETINFGTVVRDSALNLKPSAGLEETVTGTYTLKVGTLTVTVKTSPNHNPANSAATWTLSQTSTVSGYSFASINGTGTQSFNDVPLGVYKVVFHDVAGWTTPATENVTVRDASPAPSSATDGNDAKVTGTYILKVQSITVTVATNPNHDPANSSATWTISADSTVTGIPFTDVSGTGTETVKDVPLGSYKVKFDDLAGWDKPGNKTVSVTAGNDVSTTGTFKLLVGTLKVNVATDPKYNPQNNNATWTVSQISSVSGFPFSAAVGTGTHIITDVPLGTYKVVFDDANGWNTPGDESVDVTAAVTDQSVKLASITNGNDAEVTGTYTLKVGTLTVTVGTNPNYDPANGAATWTLSQTTSVSGFSFSTVNGTGSQSFDDVPLGEYTIVFDDLSGWTTPATENVTVAEASTAPSGATDGNDASVIGTYILKVQLLTVKVATNPNYDPANSAATWTVTADSTVTGISFTDVNGTGTVTINDVPLGSYKVKFDELTGWDKPGNRTVSLSEGSDSSTTGTYDLEVGTLTINVETDPNYDPQNNNATWTISQTSSVSGFPFTATSGTGTQSINDVPLGTYALVFDDVDGWETPADQTLLLPAVNDKASSVNPAGSDYETSATGTYILKVGTLTVNIASDPDWDDTNNSATWTVSATSTITGISFTAVTGSGTETITDVPLGTYEVVYDDLIGWVTPANDTVTVEESSSAPADATDGNDASTTGNYTLQQGVLTVTITTSLPPTIETVNAAWSLSGTSVGGPSFSTTGTGSSTPTIPTGDYTISYGDITSWDTPADDPFTMTTAGETVIGHYVRHLGSVQVFITPDAAIAGGAQWRSTPSEGWRNSGTTADGIPTGRVDIEFHSATDYFTPTSVAVDITKDTTQTIIVSYNKDLTGTGNLQINIDGVNGNGNGSAPANLNTEPQWRFAGEDTWYDSGTIIANIANGDYDVEFSVVEGHVPPSQTRVTVKPGIDNNVDAQYLRPFIVHKSDYDGDGAEDLAVFDSNTRMWSIASSGKAKTSTSANLIFEKKYGTKESIPTPGDYDGDGLADLSYYLESKGEWRVFKQFKLKGFGQVGDIPVPGDYDGDGNTDPALYRPSTGEWYIYDRVWQKTMKVTFGSAKEIPVPGNYDGDAAGTTDLAVYDVTTGKWRIAVYNPKKNKWVSKKKLGSTFGSVGEVPVQADYDGDGKTDVALYNRETGTWRVKDQFEIELGIEGDIPVPNDWAGLGRAIPAIFRAKTGAWIALDNLLTTRHGAGGRPLVSGR